MPAGDANEFEDVIDAHWATVRKLALRMTGDRGDAEEITQQTFFLAYRAWPTFARRAKVMTSLFRIAVNACQQHMIKRRRERTVPLDQAPAIFTHDHDPIEARESLARLDVAMQAISPLHRMVLTLFCLEDLDHEAIAEVLDCPVGTVWSRLHSARAALARHYQPEAE
tara:strand:- start:11930 stop:12433 length:504 start_codon:yes stop_codon:yes gene_type:complete